MTTSVPVMEPQAAPRRPDFTQTIIDVLRDALDERDWSYYRLIQVSGLPPQRVYRWFRCGNSPTLDDLVVTAAALDMPFVDLMAEAKRRYDEAGR